MQYRKKNKQQLVDELSAADSRIKELEKAELERKRVEKALAWSARVSERLRVLMVTMNDCRTIDDALVLLLEAALEVCRMDVGGVYVIEGDHAILRHQHNLPKEFERAVRQMPLSSKEVKKVFEMREPVKAEDISQEIQSLCRVHGLNHCYSVPLRAGSEVFGFLNLASSRCERLEDGTVEILRGLAAQGESLFRRLQTEEALRESEERFRSMTEATSEFIWEVDRDGNYGYASPKVRDLLGYEPEEIIGRRLFNFMMPETAAREEEEFRKVTRARRPFKGWVNRRIHKSGRRVVVETSGVPILDAKGDLVGYRGIDHDATERAKAEEALIESERRFRNIVESSPMGMHMYKLDSEGRLVFVGSNPAADRMTGVDNSQFLDKTIEEAFPSSKDTEIPERYRRAAERGEPWQSEQIEYQDDQIKGAYDVYAFQTSPGNMVALFHEITRRKRAEEALRENEEKYRHLVENINEIIYTVDQSGVITYISPGVETLTGNQASKVVGRMFGEFIHPDDQVDVSRNFKKLLSGHLQSNAFRILTKDGEVRWVRSSSRPLYRDGQVVGLQGVLADFTAAKEANEEKRNLEVQLRQAQKMEAIGHLAGGVAHDFNNLLSPILGYAELILMDMHPDDPRYGSLAEVRKAAIRARDLTRQLLAFGRKQVIEMKTLDLSELVFGFEKMLRRTIREDIDIKIQNSPSLGNVKGDLSQIEQILMNLALNAQDAMPSGGTLIIETRNVSVDDRYLKQHPEAQLGEHVMLAVSDNGVGIDRAIRDRIFEPFFTTKEEGKGTGLGLATVYGIVRQHNGSIRVYSEPGKKTTFSILLPRVDSPVEVGTRAPLYPARSRGTETVMVVEDNKMVRNLTCSVLEEYGYKVLSAAGAQECLELVERAGHVHLLITDVVMPEMNGSELYQRLSSFLPKMKVLFMSGYASDLIAHHGVLQKGDRFIQKPFSLEVLTRKVRQVLDSK